MAVVTLFPTTNAAYSGAGLTNPNNAHSDNAIYATAAPAKNANLGTRYGTFGFDAQIPAAASITKVQLIYEYKTSVNTSIAVARTRARISGVDQALHDDATEPAADTVKTIDITADRSWTRSDLLDGTLEAVLEGRRGNSNTGVTFSFDYIKVEVTYTVAYSLTAAQATFTRTGQAATPKVDRKLTAAGATASETGQTANLTKGYPMTAANAVYSEAGQVAALRHAFRAVAALGTFAEAGQAATKVQTYNPLNASRGTVGHNGQVANLIHAFNLMVAGAGALAITGPANTLRYARNPLVAAASTLALTGPAQTIRAQRILRVTLYGASFSSSNTGLIHVTNEGDQNADIIPRRFMAATGMTSIL